MVLVTGASGFLGRHLVRSLSAGGVATRALYYAHPPAPELASLPFIEWKKCDLLDVFDVEEVMTGITEVYHCAAIVTFDRRQMHEMLHFNPESTANVVNEALLQGVRKLVHVSSIAALGRTGVKGKEIDEEEEWGESRYNSAYGISKYIAEAEVWRAIGEGLNAVIINPGIIVSANELHGIMGRVLQMAYNEFPFYTEGVTSWVDIGDVTTLMMRLMNSEINASRFIVSGGNFSFREIFTIIAKAMNRKPPRYHAGSFMTGMAWRLSKFKSAFTGNSPVITRETAHNADTVCIYNNGRLLKAFPDFTYSPVEQTIGLMARSFGNSNKK